MRCHIAEQLQPKSQIDPRRILPLLKKMFSAKTIHLRLCWDSNPAKTLGLPAKITHLISGLNEAQVLCVSVQKEFSKRQSGSHKVNLLI